MFLNVLYGAIGSVLGAFIIWLLIKGWNIASFTRSFLREFPDRIHQEIDEAKKVKSRAAAFEYAEHLISEARFMSLISFLVAILGEQMRVQTESVLSNIVPIIFKGIFTSSVGISVLSGWFFATLAINLSTRVRQERAFDVEDKKRN